MNLKTVKKFTAEVGWGFLATSDEKKSRYSSYGELCLDGR